MHGNLCATRVAVRALIVGLLVTQITHYCAFTEANRYSQPYGDIVAEEDENTFDARNVGSRYEDRNTARMSNNNQAGGPADRYQNGYGGRRMGDRENSPHQHSDDRGNTYYKRNNHNPVRSGSNGYMPASNIVEGQPGNVMEDPSYEVTDNKCLIWVPTEALEKYPEAEKKQENKNAGSVYIKVCCKGYAPMRWRSKTLCRPVCDNCLNGRCIAPGVCECYDEYVANDNGDCVFTCPIGCLNGRCYLDGSCECDPGFKLDRSRKFCKPICSKGCGNSPLHNCTEPEVCGCIKGYTLTDNDCQPVCQHDCGIGGTCRQPDVCDCFAGFDLKDGVCQADCYQKCDNGICFSRNRCICNPGFTYHERSTQCIPK